jgi:hypothetical protein
MSDPIDSAIDRIIEKLHAGLLTGDLHCKDEARTALKQLLSEPAAEPVPEAAGEAELQNDMILRMALIKPLVQLCHDARQSKTMLDDAQACGRAVDEQLPAIQAYAASEVRRVLTRLIETHSEDVDVDGTWQRYINFSAVEAERNRLSVPEPRGRGNND